jgi:hypothetical protein
MAFQEVHYRPVFGRVLAVVTVVLCAGGIVALLVADPESALRYAWPLVFIAVLAWTLFWRPELSVEPHGVTVVNVLRTHFIPWPAIRDIDTRFSLTLRTGRGKVPVWAAPAPGRHRVLGLAEKDFDGVGETARGPHGSLRPSDAVSVPTGNLAQLIRGQWEELRARGLLAPGEDPEAEKVTWHTGTIAALAVSAAATVLGLAA